MSETQIRFGILGCASIARKLSKAIRLAPNASLYAVGSRSLEKAKAFASANGFPASAKIYGSYESVLDDPEVDAVYLPLPTSLHVQWAVLAAQKKKHVLLEKPVALNGEELEVILSACESNGVQFMDATFWMHHPRTAKMKEFISNYDRFGQLNLVQACFGIALTPDDMENSIRVKPNLDALGALGDLGWYPIRAILWAADFELPKSVVAFRNPILNKAGVILSCGASLHWENGKIATFHCSFFGNLTTNLVVTGTNGTLYLNDYVIPFEEEKASFFAATQSWYNELSTEWRGKLVEENVVTDLPQEALMVTEFCRLVAGIRDGGLKPDEMWPIFSKKTQLVLDAVKISINRDCEPVSLR